MTVEYKNLPVEELSAFEIRDIRIDVLEKLKDRISKGYNPARPLTVVKTDNKYIVADGNHRLRVLQELGIKSVPCVIYEDVDPYKLAVAGNMDEDTYAPMDLFDWLDIIDKLRNEGLTQAQIGERIGWSRGQISQYLVLLEKIATNILILAKKYQKGRVAENATFVSFNFTEGWFRTSGLYDLLKILMFEDEDIPSCMQC
jgi:ParB-like chromosome segregation protein Spo0J